MPYLCTRNPIETVASSKHNAEIAQLVEHNLAKVGVASSSLVFRSTKRRRQLLAVFFRFVMSEAEACTKRPQFSPFRGWGINIIREKLHTQSVGSSLVFRNPFPPLLRKLHNDKLKRVLDWKEKFGFAIAT